MADATEPRELYEVDTEQYEEALGAELPPTLGATVQVDRRGYSRRVAEELGEDYMLNDIVIFGPAQQNAPVVRAEYSFIPDLLTDVYGKEEIVQYAESEEALMLDIEVTSEDDGFYGRALLEDTDVREAIEHAEEVRNKLRTVTEDAVMQPERIRDLYAEARDVYERFGGLRDIEFSEEMGRVETDAFQFDWADGTGFAFHGTGSFRGHIAYDGDRPDHMSFPVLNVRQDEHTLPHGVGTVLQSLHAAGHVEIDTDGIMERRDEVAADALEQRGVDVEVGRLAFYQAMEEHEDDMPAEYHILRYLGRDEDFSVDTAEDTVKLKYVTVPTIEVEEDDEVHEEIEHPIAAAYLDHLRAKDPMFFHPDDADEPATEDLPDEEPEQDTPVRVGNDYGTTDSSSNIEFIDVLEQYADEGFDKELQNYLEERLDAYVQEHFFPE